MLEQLPDNHPLLTTDKATYSKGMLKEMSCKLAVYLKSHFVNAGDNVVVLTNDKKAILTCASACYESGLVLISLDPTLGVVQITSTLNLVKPKAVLADNTILQMLSNAKTPLPDLVLDTSSKPSVRKWFNSKALHWKTTHAIFNSTCPERTTNSGNLKAIESSQAAYIMFTSGTTDHPKGVVVTRAALQKHVATLCNVFNYNHDSKLLCFLPTHHTDGLVHCCYVPLLTGMCAIHPGAFNMSTNFEHIGLFHKPTHFLAVPTILSMLRDLYSDKPNLFRSHGTHTVISTAGVLEKSFAENFNQTFGIKIRNFYGLTETISGALYCDTSVHPPESLGIPIGVEARLIANNTIVTDFNTAGELQLRSDQIMHSYYDNPKATAEAFDKGWFKTGDVFTVDEAGHYHFKFRLKDIIKKGGVSLYPKDICHHILNYPDIKECEVVGLQDAVFEEAIAACIVVEKAVNLPELADYCKEVLANEMQPDYWVVCRHLPRTSVGKVDKPKLQDIVKKQIAVGEAESLSDDTLEKSVLDLAAYVFKTDLDSLRTGMGKNQIAGWDSYAHLKFIKQIEKEYDIRLKARDIMQIETLEDVVTFIRAKTRRSEAA